MFWTGSKQFVYGVATLAVLVLLMVGLIAFFGGIGQPTPGSTSRLLEPGTYTVTVSKEDVSARDAVDHSARFTILGEWLLTLSERGHYILTLIGYGVIEEGRYALTSEQLVFTGEKGLGLCVYDSGAQVGTYEWAFDGRALTLTTVEDECANRNYVWTTHPWSKLEHDLAPGTYVTDLTQEDFVARDDLDLFARTILLGEWEMTLSEGNGYSHIDVSDVDQARLAHH